jgi:hypothetical protein
LVWIIVNRAWCLSPTRAEGANDGELKLGTIEDLKPVRLTIELPAAVHRDLLAYDETLARQTAQGTIEPAKLIAPMLARFMATDRAFARARRIT